MSDWREYRLQIGENIDFSHISQRADAFIDCGISLTRYPETFSNYQKQIRWLLKKDTRNFQFLDFSIYNQELD